jgi:hypothetical protein
MDKDKIIDITKHFKTFNAPWVQTGIDAFNSLSPEQTAAAIELILNYTFKEVEAGLGLIDLNDDEDVELIVFDKIADIYDRAAGDCYFCSSNIDPNEEEFGPNTKLCLTCKLKLANFTQALGIPSEKVFDGLRARAQKTTIKIK